MSPWVKVLAIRQSPDTGIWILALECGHEQNFTHKGRPEMKYVICNEAHEEEPKP